MKKLLAILLALCVVTVAFAQPVAKIAFDGNFVLFNDASNADVNFNTVSGGTGTFSFSATDKDGVTGLSFGIGNLYGSYIETASTAADSIASMPGLYNSSWKGWYYAFDKKVKFSLGRFSWSDYRTTGYWNFDTGYPGTANRVLATVYPMDGLELAASIPFAATGEAAVDTYKKTDLGFKYAIKDFGTVKGYADLNLVTKSNVVAVGLTFAPVENLNVVAAYKGTLATASTHAFGVSGDYTMDKLTVYGEFDGTAATAFTWTLYAGAAYVMDKVEFDFDASFDSASAYDAGVTATYTVAPGLTAGVNLGYNGSLYYSVPLKFKIAF